MVNLEGPAVKEGLGEPGDGACLAWGMRRGEGTNRTQGREATVGEACSGEKGTHFRKTSFMSSPCDALSPTVAKAVVFGPPHLRGRLWEPGWVLRCTAGAGGAQPRSSNKVLAGLSWFFSSFY